MKKNSFTLLELMVSITIITILLSVAVPKYDKYILKGRFDTEAVPMLQAISMAQEQYKNETGYYYPNSYITADTFMQNGNKIEEFLKIDLSNTYNFLYSIKTNSDGTEFTIRATLRKNEVWKNENCDNLDDSTIRCVASSNDKDDWLNAQPNRGINKYFIEYTYPTSNTNNINRINYSNMLTH